MFDPIVEVLETSIRKKQGVKSTDPIAGIHCIVKSPIVKWATLPSLFPQVTQAASIYREYQVGQIQINRPVDSVLAVPQVGRKV